MRQPSIASGTLGPKAAGFTLIEVLVALLVLAFGLLGFALMQTTTVRFAQSANHRTIATNLAHELLDNMRANRLLAGQYAAVTTTSFGGVGDPPNCGFINATLMDPATNIERWRCQIRAALPDGEAQVLVQSGLVTVTINWNDSRWEPNASDRITSFQVSTRL